MKNYFLTFYTLLNSALIPATIFCAIFADDIVAVLLGPKWSAAALIFRLLTPTMLILGMIEPLGWLLLSIGRQGRSVAMAAALSFLILLSCLVGVAHGPAGIALAYSIALTLWVVPHTVWALRGTVFSIFDLLSAVSGTLLASITAGAITIALQTLIRMPDLPALRIIAGGGCMLSIYLTISMMVFGRKELYQEFFYSFSKSFRSA